MEIGRKLAIMATVVTVALAAIGIMALIVVVKLKLSSCDLVALEPRLNLKELANLESADAKVMANFQGYLRYSQTRASAHNIFLPLKLEAVGYWRTQNGVQVVLSADCGRVSFDYMLANGSQGKNSVVSMTITIGRGYEQAAKVCHIYHPNIMAICLGGRCDIWPGRQSITHVEDKSVTRASRQKGSWSPFSS